jgi:hypothetical protein
MDNDPVPDRTMAHVEKIEWMIESAGWAFEAVSARIDPSPPAPPYGYTIGLEDRYHFPEVIVFGMTAAAARGLVGLVVDLLESGAEPPVHALFVGLLDNDLRAALLPVVVHEHRELFGTAIDWFAGRPFRVVQFVWPDRSGWLPWESGFDSRLRFAQPVIGNHADL